MNHVSGGLKKSKVSTANGWALAWLASWHRQPDRYRDRAAVALVFSFLVSHEPGLCGSLTADVAMNWTKCRGRGRVLRAVSLGLFV